jgi:hypothetical protein
MLHNVLTAKHCVVCLNPELESVAPQINNFESCKWNNTIAETPEHSLSDTVKQGEMEKKRLHQAQSNE